jgi:hypothetical protein
VANTTVYQPQETELTPKTGPIRRSGLSQFRLACRSHLAPLSAYFAFAPERTITRRRHFREGPPRVKIGRKVLYRFESVCERIASCEQAEPRAGRARLRVSISAQTEQCRRSFGIRRPQRLKRNDWSRQARFQLGERCKPLQESSAHGRGQRRINHPGAGAGWRHLALGASFGCASELCTTGRAPMRFGWDSAAARRDPSTRHHLHEMTNLRTRSRLPLIRHRRSAFAKDGAILLRASSTSPRFVDHPEAIGR